MARTKIERVAIGFGAFYVVLGIVGFLFTGIGGSTFFGLDPDQAILGLITLNGMHNVAHIGFGTFLVVAAGIAATTHRSEVARGAVIGLGAVYLIATIIGFTGAFTNFLNIPEGAAGLPDNLFHLLSAAFLFAFGFSGAEQEAREEMRRPVGAAG